MWPVRVSAEDEDFRARGFGVLMTLVVGLSLSSTGDSGAEPALERLVDLLPLLVGDVFVGVEVREGGRSGSGNCLGWWRVETITADCMRQVFRAGSAMRRQ